MVTHMVHAPGFSKAQMDIHLDACLKAHAGDTTTTTAPAVGDSTAAQPAQAAPPGRTAPAPAPAPGKHRSSKLRKRGAGSKKAPGRSPKPAQQASRSAAARSASEAQQDRSKAAATEAEVETVATPPLSLQDRLAYCAAQLLDAGQHTTAAAGRVSPGRDQPVVSSSSLHWWDAAEAEPPSWPQLDATPTSQPPLPSQPSAVHTNPVFYPGIV